LFLFKFELFNKSTKSPKAKEANRQVKEVSDVGVGIVVVNVDDGVDTAAVADVGRPFSTWICKTKMIITLQD